MIHNIIKRLDIDKDERISFRDFKRFFEFSGSKEILLKEVERNK